MINKYVSISEVKPVSIRRYSSFIDELDWMYGYSSIKIEENSNFCINIWGLPFGKISNWIGEGGVGKSRLAIDLARRRVLNGKKVLYFQNEVDISTFASWINSKNGDMSNFYCSSNTSLSSQIEMVRELKPDIIIVDSINLLNEFGSGTSSDIKTIVDGYRSVINETGSHVIFLCQLNKDGSAKGSTSLTHLPDINFILTKENDGFRVSVGNKNRYGRTGDDLFGIWRHTESGVECVSNNRLSNKKWREFHFLSENDLTSEKKII